MIKKVFTKSYRDLYLNSFFYTVVLLLSFGANSYSQCFVPVGCPNTDLSNFGSNSTTNAATIEYDNYVSSFHSTIVRSTSGFKVWGEKMANDGTTAVLSPITINATNFPALGTSTPLKAGVGSDFNNYVQGIVLTTDGLYAWAVEGIVLDASITTGTNFQKIAIGGNSTGLPAGVTPADVKMMFVTGKVLAITTCDGNVWVLSQEDTSRGNGDSYLVPNTGSAILWSRVTTTAPGNPFLTNVVACRGSSGNLMALKSDGSVYVWGNDVYLGNNTVSSMQPRARQMTLPVGITPKMIGSTGGIYSVQPTFYILGTDGKLFSLGQNDYHQLGNWNGTESLTWVRPRYNSAIGPFMDNILWISPQEHDKNNSAINVINSDYNIFAFGSNKDNMIGGASPITDPMIPNGLNALDKILSVETGGHTSMVVKQCTAKFGYVGHRINGSMADGTDIDAYEPAYTFNTTALEICGAESGVTIQPKTPGINGSYSNYCKTASVELVTTPAGGTLTYISGPATLTGNTINFTGPGSVVVKYAVSSLCNGSNEILKTFTITDTNTTTSASTTPTLCINTPLTSITHTTTGATAIGTPTGLPAGVTASFASNTITISGTPTVSGVFNYSIVLTGDCSSATATGTITVNAASVAGSVTGGTTICSGSNSALLTLSGITGNVVKWQSSVAPFSTWTDITNTATTYTSGALTQTTQFRAVVQSGTCAAANSTPTTVTVDPTTVAGSVAGGTTICSGSNSALLTLSGITGNVVKWQSSVAPFSTWTDITNTATTYTSGALTQTTQFRAVVQSGTCAAVNSAATTVTVDPTTVAGSVAGGTTICSGSNSALLTLSGITGNVVKWQSSVAPFSIWTDITNTATTYTSGALTQTTQFRAVVQSGTCAAANSVATTVTVDPTTVAGSVAGGTTICSGSNSALLTLSGITGNVVKWQSSVAPFSIWTDITNTATTYTSGALTQTTQFRAVVQSGTCAAANSTPTTVTVDPTTVAGSIAGGTTICSGSNSALLTLSGITGNVVKWQSSVAPFSIWTDITNTATTYTSGALTQTTQFRAVVQSGTCAAANSTPTTVTVDPTTVAGSVAGGTTICSGSNSALLTLSGITGNVVKWQSSVAPFSIWTDITNTATTYTSGALTQTTQFRAVVQSGTCAAANSVATTVTVDPTTVAGSVAGGTTICSGSNSALLTLSGITGNVVKWQSSVAPFSIWTDITNTATTYTSGALTQTTQFRAVVQSGTCAAANSTPTTVTVDPTTVAGSIAGGTTICSGSNSALLTLSGITGNVVKWQSSVAPFSIWTDITNTATTYTSGALTQTTQFRAVVQSGTCAAANSTPTTVTVDPTTVAGSVAGGTTICSGSNSALLTLSGITGNVVKWQSSVAPFSIWTDITNTATTYTSGALTQTTQFRAVVQSGTCAAANSVATTVTVNDIPSTPVVGIISHPKCSTSTGNVVLTGLPSGNWTINPGGITGNTPTTTISGLTNGTYNYTVTNSSNCTSQASLNVEIFDSICAQDDANAVSVISPLTGTTVAYSTILVNNGNGTDTVNAAAATLSTVSITLATGSTVPSALTFNPTTGEVLVNQGAAPGTYTFNYTICEIANTNNCDNGTVTVTVADNISEIIVYNAFSPDGDAINSKFIIKNIEKYPDNYVTIYNRWGIKVYDVKGYNNEDIAFAGISDGRSTIRRNEKLPDGTYFYVLRFVNPQTKESKEKVGYLYMSSKN